MIPWNSPIKIAWKTQKEVECLLWILTFKRWMKTFKTCKKIWLAAWHTQQGTISLPGSIASCSPTAQQEKCPDNLEEETRYINITRLSFLLLLLFFSSYHRDGAAIFKELKENWMTSSTWSGKSGIFKSPKLLGNDNAEERFATYLIWS